MVDAPDVSKDERIGNHIVKTRLRTLEVLDDDDMSDIPIAPYTKSQMQLYIKYIRTIKPRLTAQVDPKKRK